MWIYHIQIFNMFQPVKVIAKKSEILPVPGCDPWFFPRFIFGRWVKPQQIEVNPDDQLSTESESMFLKKIGRFQGSAGTILQNGGFDGCILRNFSADFPTQNHATAMAGVMKVTHPPHFPFGCLSTSHLGVPSLSRSKFHLCERQWFQALWSVWSQISSVKLRLWRNLPESLQKLSNGGEP